MHGTYINGFSKKILIWDNWTILGPKMVRPRNSGYTLRTFLKFCLRKWANRNMKIILMVFQKKNHFGQKGLFWARK